MEYLRYCLIFWGFGYNLVGMCLHCGASSLPLLTRSPTSRGDVYLSRNEFLMQGSWPILLEIFLIFFSFTLKYLICFPYFWQWGKARRWVPPLYTQYLWKSAESREQRTHKIFIWYYFPEKGRWQFDYILIFIQMVEFNGRGNKSQSCSPPRVAQWMWGSRLSK